MNGAVALFPVLALLLAACAEGPPPLSDEQVLARHDAEMAGSLGLASMDQQDYQLAIYDFGEALKSDVLPVDARETYLTDQGVAYGKSGRCDMAIIDYTAALKLENDKIALNDRGLCHIAENQPALAAIDFDAAIKLDPEYAEAFMSRGQLRRQMANYEGAVADETMALSLKPYLTDALVERGKSYLALRRASLALADFDAALRRDPDSDAARAARGLAVRASETSAFQASRAQ